MKFIYLFVIVVLVISYVVNEVDGHKKHKHKGGRQHVYHHHYYYSDRGHVWGPRYKREIIDIVDPDSMGPLTDNLTVSAKIAEEKIGELGVEETKPPIGAIVRDVTKEVKVNDKIQNVASFAL